MEPSTMAGQLHAPRRVCRVGVVRLRRRACRLVLPKIAYAQLFQLRHGGRLGVRRRIERPEGLERAARREQDLLRAARVLLRELREVVHALLVRHPLPRLGRRVLRHLRGAVRRQVGAHLRRRCGHVLPWRVCAAFLRPGRAAAPGHRLGARGGRVGVRRTRERSQRQRGRAASCSSGAGPRKQARLRACVGPLLRVRARRRRRRRRRQRPPRRGSDSGACLRGAGEGAAQRARCHRRARQHR